MKKLVLFMLLMLPVAVFGQKEGNSEKNSLMEKFSDLINQLNPAGQAILLDVMKNSQIDSVHIKYALPNGETIEAIYDDETSVENFWKKIGEYNLITEICNVPFGSTYEDAKSILTDKYGDYDYLSSTKDDLVYKNKKYAGVDFDVMHFMFQSNGERSYFNTAILCMNCRSKADAIRTKQRMHDTLSKRYSAFVNMDGDDLYLSMGGISPVPTERNYGFGVRIDIVDYGKSGQVLGTPYGVRIIYGPYDYVKEEF